MVLAIFKQEERCDFDRPRNYASEHQQLRQMLGYGSLDFDLEQYSRQRLVDNFSFLSSQLLEQTNPLIVQTNVQLCGVKADKQLSA